MIVGALRERTDACLRIIIGTDAEMDALMKALDEIGCS